MDYYKMAKLRLSSVYGKCAREGYSVPSAYSSHRTSYVWLRGFHKVIGINLDELNKHIDYYNNVSGRWLTFWEYLTFEIKDNVYGFDCLWNEGNPLFSKVKTILPQISYADSTTYRKKG